MPKGKGYSLKNPPASEMMNRGKGGKKSSSHSTKMKKNSSKKMKKY